jgi:dipeptidyl aminopeptidase/acylaminoacyl peptidase
MQDDVADALLWAQKQGFASERACIAGASYGGYSTLMGLARHPELYRCGAAWVALTDLLLYVEGNWWVDDDISDYGRRVSLLERVGNPKDEAERAMLIDQSPIHQAERIRAPVLLAFGEDDRRIPLQHGKRMREALEKAGRTPEWVVYPGEGHGWRLPANRVDFAERLERSGVPTQLHCAQGLNHGFLKHAGRIPTAQAGLAQGCDWLRALFSNASAPASASTPPLHSTRPSA